MAEGQKKSSRIGDAVAGQAARLATRQVVSKATAAVGTAIGGPVGTAVGHAVGGMLSNVASGAATFVNRNKKVVLASVAGIGTGLAAIPAMALAAVTAGAAAAGGALMTAIIGIPVVVAFLLLVINNSAYMVPPSAAIPGSEPGIPLPGNATCPAENEPAPVSVNVEMSADGRYAFPVANGSSNHCYHWDGGLAVDIFPISTYSPVVAYTSGTISIISMNDSKGGKYVILEGDDGRYYYYAHNCALYVEEGDRVSVGQTIATTDTTGSARGTSEHLHFAIANRPNFYNGGTVCPMTDFEEKFSRGQCSTNRTLDCTPSAKL